MTIFLSDPRVAAIPVAGVDEPLVALAPEFGPARALVRTGLADRLAAARAELPFGIDLRITEGYRSVTHQQAIITRYSAQVRAAHPQAGPAELRELTSRFVAPVEVAPHVAGAAVDLTLVDAMGVELDLGTPIDATPEECGGRCFTAARDIRPAARLHRALLAQVLGDAGLVNYPTEWWHWSYGDRYWALVTGAAAALHGPARIGTPA